MSSTVLTDACQSATKTKFRNYMAYFCHQVERSTSCQRPTKHHCLLSLNWITTDTGIYEVIYFQLLFTK